MISNELQKIKNQLETKGKMHFIVDASVEQVAQFKEKKKIKFPAKYKDWLLFNDGGECYLPAGVQFFGKLRGLFCFSYLVATRGLSVCNGEKWHFEYTTFCMLLS